MCYGSVEFYAVAYLFVSVAFCRSGCLAEIVSVYFISVPAALTAGQSGCLADCLPISLFHHRYVSCVVP